jgi:molybdopterin-guanine dinucleotide biosynthesis protein A
MSEPVTWKSEPRTETVAALILAGGESRRMGQDKALLEWAGVPCLRRTCDLALACTTQVAVMTPWPDRYRTMVPPAVRLLSETWPLGKSQGPLLGFAQGLAYLDTDWILLLACDLPGLTVPTLRQWQLQLAHVPSDAIATLPRSAQGWEPLCGFYRHRCQASLNQAIIQGVRSFQHWLVDQIVAPLTAAPQHLVNCNTPEDWQQFLQTHPSIAP